MQIGQLSEEDSLLFKKWLKSHLAFGPVTVTFTKKDGTERVMECTTSPSIVPQETIDPMTPKKEKKVNEDVCPVYDLEAKHWKSFRWESVKSVSFTIGENNEHNDKAQ